MQTFYLHQHPLQKYLQPNNPVRTYIIGSPAMVIIAF